MARNGSGVYSLPGTYLAVSGETIEAQQHNDPLEDLEADANNARPIAAGGTGATSAADARTNLGVPSTSEVLNYAFPSGTAMLFQQTAAPTGWTKQTTHNDKALRVVSGTAGSGGSTAFTSVFAARTIAQTNLPAVAPTFTGTSQTWTSNQSNIAKSSSAGSSPNDAGNTYPVYAGFGTITVTVTPAGTISNLGSGTAMDFAVQYVDVIVATKDP